MSPETPDSSLSIFTQFGFSPPTYLMSVKIFNRKILLKLCDEDLDKELIFEGQDNSIVFNYLTDEQRIITIWNRSAAIAIAKAIYKYYDLAPAN